MEQVNENIEVSKKEMKEMSESIDKKMDERI